MHVQCITVWLSPSNHATFPRSKLRFWSSAGYSPTHPATHYLPPPQQTPLKVHGVAVLVSAASVRNSCRWDPLGPLQCVKTSDAIAAMISIPISDLMLITRLTCSPRQVSISLCAEKQQKGQTETPCPECPTASALGLQPVQLIAVVGIPVTTATWMVVHILNTA